MTDETPLSLARDVVLLPVDDGSARLLDLGGSFHALSRSGHEMLSATLESGAPKAVARTAARYAVDPARVRADLDALLAELRVKGLVRGADGPDAAAPRRRAARAAIRAFAGTPLARSAGALLVFARLSFAWFGWSETVAAWAEVLDGAEARRPAGGGDAGRVDARVRSVAARLPGVDCKERALAAWILLARRGIPTTLVVGVHLYPLTGHCWCEAGGRVLTDDPLFCRAYRAVARYEIGGAGVRAAFAGAGSRA